MKNNESFKIQENEKPKIFKGEKENKAYYR